MSATAPIPYAEIHALTEAVLRAGVMLSAEAAGAATVHDTTALLGAVCDRVVADLRAALDLARGDP